MPRIKRGDSVIYTGAGKQSPVYEAAGKVLDIVMGRGVEVAEVRWQEIGVRYCIPVAQLKHAGRQSVDPSCGEPPDDKPNPRRHKSGVMNKTEARYESEYLSLMKASGRYTQYFFESATFLLAHDCRYTPDFMVELPQEYGRPLVEVHEVKGTRDGKPYWEDDAKVKMQTFAAKFPFRLIVAYEIDGEWLHHEIKG